MTKILVFGAGGVGGIYTYVLDKGGAAVTAVCRSNYAAVQENGFHITSKVFGDVHVRPNVVSSPSEAAGEKFDYILICSKATVGGAASTPSLIKPAVGPTTTIVLAQNGIGIEDEYVAAFPSNPLISGVVYLPTTQEAPGHIAMGDLEHFEIGTYPATAPEAWKQRAEAFAAIFRAGGATCTVYADIQSRRWSKLTVNASWNPICALTLLDDASYLRSSPMAEDIVRLVMYEVMAVAHAKGYREIDEKVIEWQLERPRARLMKEGKEPSMLTDVRMGRGLEVEAIVGNAVRIAREVGVETPRLDLVYVLARGLDIAIRRAG